MRRVASALIAVALVGAACSGGGSGGEPAADSPEPVITDEVDCDEIARTFVGRERPVPGGAVQLDVFAIGRGGAFVDGSDCVSVRDDADGARVEAVARSVPTSRRLIAIVADPGRTPEQLDSVRELTSEIIDALPDAEIALYGLGAFYDEHAGGVDLFEDDVEWVVADPSATLDPNWRTSSFLLEGSFLRPTSVAAGWPEPSAPEDPVFGRALFSLFDGSSVADAELTIEHTHGAVVWINGTEVLRSNMSSDSDTPADPTAGIRTASATIPGSVFRAGTNVLSVDVHRAPNGDPVVVTPELIVSDSQQRPVAALAPVSSSPDPAVVGELEPTSSAPGRLDEALDLVVTDLEQIHDDETDALRAVVVVTPEPVPDVELSGRADAVLAWVGDGTQPRGDLDLAIDADSGEVGPTLSGRLDHVAASRLVLGICGPGRNFEAEVEVGTVNLTTTLRDPPPEDPGGECDAEDAAQYDPAPPERVAVSFTPTERAVWEQTVATSDRSPFRASVDLGGGWGEAPAELRLRGQSTIDCDRKSYEVNLDTGHRRVLTEAVAADEFFLVSLCLDEGYIRSASMLGLLAEMGLFPVGFRLVELELAGEPAGIYLLIEPPEEALRDAQPQLDGVVRRALDTSFQQSSTSWSDSGRGDVVFGAYEAVIESAETGGTDILAPLSEDLDVDAYLRWLATMSATGNGDYVDEVFFAGVGVPDGDTIAPYWFPVGWDPDDIFSPCHFEDFQFEDPLGLSSCAEARLDHALLGNEEGYAAYVLALQQVLEFVTPDRFETALTTTRDRLAELVDDDSAAAMPELALVTGLDTSSADGFMAAVDREVAELANRYEERHATLSEVLEDLRAFGDRTSRAPEMEVEFVNRSVVGAAVPVRITAVEPGGAPDRARAGSVTVSLAGVTVDVPMRRGVGVATLEPTNEGDFELVVEGAEVGVLEVVDSGDAAVAGAVGPADERIVWGPGLLAVQEDVAIAPGQVVVIEAGTTLVMGEGVNIDVAGRLESRGTAAEPVLFTDLESPWGGIGGTGEVAFSHTFLTGGGGDGARVYGHSESQPLVFGGAGSRIVLEAVVVVDSGGKALAVDGGAIEVTNSVFTRTDTGGEFHNAEFDIASSWFFDFPETGGSGGDDDNDAIYLGPTRATSFLRDTVFMFGADDGVDHAGADVVIERVWIEGFAHECLATSTGGTVEVRDSVLSDCEQGLQVGYGSPSVLADHLLIRDNDIGVRYGDEYFIEATGSLQLTSTLLVGNGVPLEPESQAVTVVASVTDDTEVGIAGLSSGDPQLDDDLVWRQAGADAAGILTGWPRVGDQP